MSNTTETQVFFGISEQLKNNKTIYVCRYVGGSTSILRSDDYLCLANTPVQSAQTNKDPNIMPIMSHIATKYDILIEVGTIGEIFSNVWWSL